VTDREREIEYYRQVEDFFAGLRGVPHVLSPRDFQLLREWWRDGVPLAAVLGGIAEVFEKKRERNDPDPVVSLTYCRHAVARHARALAEARTGRHAPSAEAPPGTPPGEALEAIAEALEAAARETGAAAARRALSGAVDRLRRTAPRAENEAEAADILASVETWLLAALREALPSEEREALEEEARALARRSGARGEAFDRTVRAAEDRALRRRFRLPRLEIE